MENLLIIIAGVAIILAISYAVFNFFCVKKLEEGTEKMGDIAGAIRIGANAFIKYEYKLVAIIGAVIAVLVLVVISWQAAIAFVIGAVMSASAGWVGMKIATYANVRVTNTARQSKDLGKTLKTAFKGGSVMGLCVAGFALLGIVFVYCVFGLAGGQIADIANGVHQKNFIGLETSFTMTLSGYALGCSIIAMFNRVGGGIYTKAADMGADLVGKTEAHIPEDDPRNPATIADNVGDNVGDVAGLGSDLLESYVGAILSAIILAGELFMHQMIPDTALLQSMLLFPLVFAGCGLLACIIGISYIVLKPRLSKNVHMELNIATWIAAGLTACGMAADTPAAVIADGTLPQEICVKGTLADIAKRVRRGNDAVQIVFITGYPDFIAEGYEVSALHYLMKPVSYEKLCGVLDKAVTNLAKAEKRLCITYDRRMDFVPLSRILYIEAQRQWVLIHTFDEIYRMKKSLAETGNELNEYFFKCQRSYLVNLWHVTQIRSSCVVLKNGEEVPISRGMAEKIGKEMIRLF